MLFQKILKNAINNNDFFKIRKSKENKYTNNRYLKNNSNNLSNLNLSQFNIDNSNINISLLSNNISAQNNIGKYKEKIIARQNRVEQNYKNFNKYKDNFYNKLHSRYNNKIPPRNGPKTFFKREGNRLYKSGSTGNIFTNYFYLSEQLLDNNKNNSNNKINYKIYNINNTNRFFDKRRTDITDNSIIQIKNNKQGFVDYYNKIVEVQNENIKTSQEKKNLKEKDLFKSRLKEINNIIFENNYFNNLATQDLIGKKNSKIRYKLLLDEQVKNNLNHKLMKESLSFRDLAGNKTNIPQIDKINDRQFLNYNKFVEINLYKQRNYHLGNSFLKQDVINQPQSLFKINKYFFPKNDIGEINY